MDCFEEVVFLDFEGKVVETEETDLAIILGKTACNIRCLAADPIKNFPRPADPDREGRTRASYLKALGKTACIF